MGVDEGELRGKQVELVRAGVRLGKTSEPCQRLGKEKGEEDEEWGSSHGAQAFKSTGGKEVEE